MVDRGVKIKYGNFAPNAKENFDPTSNNNKFDTLSQLKEYDLDFQNYANPCELYQTILDGSSIVFPSNYESLKIGLFSEQISNDDGTFTTPIELTLTSDKQYSSQGLTFLFDAYNNIYATNMNIKWYRNDELLSGMDFAPNNAYYSCYNNVEYYNKIIVTFYSINMPENRLRLKSIDYGYGVFFEPKNLRNVKVIQEINPISTDIPINTVDFTIDLDANIDLRFQNKQPISVYYNGELISTAFVRSFKRKQKNIWDLQTDDYIGLLDSIPYYGGIYQNDNAVDVLVDIFTVAKTPYSIDEFFSNSKITGYIPYTTCREALMQVAFAIGAVVDTSKSDSVKVFSISDGETIQKIPSNRIMQGQSFSNEETITGIEVLSHSYLPITETIEVYNAKDSGVSNKNEDGTYEKIFIKFSEPLHDLKINGGSEYGEFVVVDGKELKHTNYAVIYAYSEECVLVGKKYNHATVTKRKNNPNILANDVEKVVTIENATLVSKNNVDNLLEKCYNYFVKSEVINERIIEGTHQLFYGNKVYGSFKYGGISYDSTLNIGDLIETETEYLGLKKGRLIRSTFNLNGNMVVKDCTIR